MSATNDQLSELPGGRDETFHNYSGSDMAAHIVVAFDTVNYIGDANGTTIPGIVLPTTGGDPTMAAGITLETIKAGGSGRVRCAGLAYAKFYAASGTLAVGAVVDASKTAAHAGEIEAHTAAKFALGIARSGGAVADMIIVDVRPHATA